MYKPEDLDKEALQDSIDAVDNALDERARAEEEINRLDICRAPARP